MGSRSEYEGEEEGRGSVVGVHMLSDLPLDDGWVVLPPTLADERDHLELGLRPRRAQPAQRLPRAGRPAIHGVGWSLERGEEVVLCVRAYNRNICLMCARFRFREYAVQRGAGPRLALSRRARRGDAGESSEWRDLDPARTSHLSRPRGALMQAIRLYTRAAASLAVPA